MTYFKILISTISNLDILEALYTIIPFYSYTIGSQTQTIYVIIFYKLFWLELFTNEDL